MGCITSVLSLCFGLNCGCSNYVKFHSGMYHVLKIFPGKQPSDDALQYIKNYASIFEQFYSFDYFL